MTPVPRGRATSLLHWRCANKWASLFLLVPVVLALGVLLLALTPAAMADFEEGLTEALVILEDESDQARIAAFPRALDQVFTKLSGRRPAQSSQMRDSELNKAALLVQRYRYRTSPSGQAPRLWVRFDAAALAESAQRAGVEVWAEPRPAPLLWVALGSAENADLIAPASEDGLDRVLLDAAWRRGLPLRLPLMDLEDRMRVKPEGVQSADVDMLVSASERYPASGPVVGASVEQGAEGGWVARWLMLNSGEQTSWRSGGASPEQALEAGVDGLADLIAPRYVAEPALPSDTKQDDDEQLRSVSNGSETIEIAVRGVGFGGDYGALMDYLRKLEGVSRFSMLPNEDERARFRLDVFGGEEAFRDIIARDDVLEPDGADSEYRMRR